MVITIHLDGITTRGDIARIKKSRVKAPRTNPSINNPHIETRVASTAKTTPTKEKHQGGLGTTNQSRTYKQHTLQMH